MEVSVDGGVKIDLATREDLHRHHDHLRQLIGDRKDVRTYRLMGSGTTTAGFTGTGPIAVSFTPMSPPAGRLWIVNYVTAWVGTTLAAGATANLNCAVMMGRCPTGPGAPIQAAVVPSISDVVIPTLTVPPPATLGITLVVSSENQLYVLLAGSGLAASTVYNIGAAVTDIPATELSEFI